MCTTDLLIKRRIKHRIHQINAASAGIELRLQYDEARWGIIITGTTASTLQWSFTDSISINAVLTKISTGAEEIKKLTFDDVGSLIWEPFEFRMTGSGQANVIELYLPTDYKSLLRIIESEK